MGNCGMITAKDDDSLRTLLERLKGEFEFVSTNQFMLKGCEKAHVLFTAEPGAMANILRIANFVNDYQI